MGSLRSKLVTFAAVAAAAVSGAAIASAATSGTSSSSSSTSAGQTRPSHDPSKGGHEFNGRTETLLTGDVASKVRAAALAKVSGTVDRVETNVDDSAPYEAHITKSDGTQVIVEINKDYSVASVSSMGGHP
jgi:uncharacterized membrane protein YkoI